MIRHSGTPAPAGTPAQHGPPSHGSPGHGPPGHGPPGHEPPGRRDGGGDGDGDGISREPRFLEAELVEQAPPGREVPLHVRVTRDSAGPGVALRGFPLPAQGARLLITVHAPGLLALGDLQQVLTVPPGRDSHWLQFGLRTMTPGLHTVTVRAFHQGTFLGELRAQISVQPGTPARDGPPRTAPLTSLAFDPGEVTLQVLKGADGAYSFQLLSETTYAPESFRLLAGDSHAARERIYDELRRMAAAAGQAGGGEQHRARRRLVNLGVQLWATAVPDAVRQQFWEEVGHVTALTVLGDHDVVPWELLYPLDGRREGDGFLAEWLPVVRRVFGQDRVRELPLDSAAFVVPPGSPPEAEREVLALRARLGASVTDGGTLTHRAAVSDLIDAGLHGVLHFACHNSFTGAGSHVTMADGPFDPIDLAYATHSGALRSSHPLVFFNACRSAGQIDWFSTSLGWAPQFLQAGAGAFIGTLWPVRSDSALLFADTFYEHLVTGGQSLGQASLRARRALRDHGGDPTWLAYAVYGSPAARTAPP
ncbi:CHAT domain-containing protein [Streptomyces sp. NPDC086081]|uniref:CHAT domain-containing protein n=1 Tax=Streptomyces sp. NPDC086081 TaxID=3365749 RepID=UPI0038022CA8